MSLRERLRQLRLPDRPDWMSKEDGLNAIWEAEQELLEEGRLAHGFVFMANSTLFEPGEGDAPAGVVYTFDPLGARFPGLLEEIGSAVYELHEPSQEQRVAIRSPWHRHLLDMHATGFERPFHLRLPPELSSGITAYTSSVMVFREHLSSGHLQEHQVQVLVGPNAPHPCLLVPEDLG